MEEKMMAPAKRDGEVVMVSLATKKGSDRLHRIEQDKIRQLERENAWLKLQLRKALAPDDVEIEIVNGCLVVYGNNHSQGSIGV